MGYRGGVYSFLHPASGIRHPDVPSFGSVVSVLSLRLSKKTVIFLCSDKTRLRSMRNREISFDVFIFQVSRYVEWGRARNKRAT